MAVPVATAVVRAWTSGTEGWDVVLPLVFVVVAAGETWATKCSSSR